MEIKEYVLSKMRDIGLQAAEVLQAKAPNGRHSPDIQRR